MTSWRENASQQAQDDLDGLLDAALGFAEQALAARGELYPYAVAVRADGQVAMIAVDPGPAGGRSAPDLIDDCVAALAAQRDGLRAAAVVSAVHVPALGSAAVDVAAEHVEGQALRVLLPYAKRRLRKGVTYGELLAQPGPRRVWT
jgi:hypothetical protein